MKIASSSTMAFCTGGSTEKVELSKTTKSGHRDIKLSEIDLCIRGRHNQTEKESPYENNVSEHLELTTD